MLTPEQMDDDYVIDMLEKSPTYKRKPDFRNQIQAAQQAASQERPVEVPKTSKRSGGDKPTINFGE